VWININYLALAALHKDPQSADTYIDLRARLIETITAGYFNSGFLFEQYDDKTRQVLFVFFFFPPSFFVCFLLRFPLRALRLSLSLPLPLPLSLSLSGRPSFLFFCYILLCPLRV
jgi:hypothetical protein